MKGLLLAAFGLSVALSGLYLTGYRLNVTPSLPRGIYLEAGGQPKRGDLVSFCLSGRWAQLAKERGYLAPGACNSGLRPLLKRVAALPGDEVLVTSDGIFTVSKTDKKFWRTPLRRHDAKGRELPESALRSGAIPQDMTLVLAEHPGSFDGRFFGLVPLASLQRVEPIFTF
ncbi:MAG: conjugative transfer signal peptidase TraF [Desulfovibrio sp.]|nr:conjugative transfer signal peptidase TraF [Desulfovibrio sp.]